MLKRWAFALLVLFVSGCMAFQDVRLGVPFRLTYGERKTIEPEGLNITFQELIEDSRCPRGVVCFWEGRVVFTLKVETGKDEGVLTFTLRPSEFPGKVCWGSYCFTALSLEPEQEVGVEIPLVAYCLTLLVEEEQER
jgi:hypothetical protein